MEMERSVETMQEYGYEDARGNLTFSLDLSKAQRVAFSTSSLIALALFVGASYYAFEKADKLMQALLVAAVAWGIFVLVRSSE
jgi:uncharacterized membrane protein (GlpM family)